MLSTQNSASLVLACAMLLASSADAAPKRTDKRARHKASKGSVHVKVPVPVVEVHIDDPVTVESTSEVTSHSQTTRQVVYAEPEPQITVRSAAPAGPSEPDRFWHLGVGLGGGALTGSSASPGFNGSLDIYAGLRISSFALAAQFWTQSRNYFSPGEGLMQQMTMLTAQLWMQDKVWIKMGIGGAYLSDDKKAGAVKGTSLMAGAGMDLFDTRHLVFNAHVKAGIGLYRDRGAYPTVAGGVGVTWY